MARERIASGRTKRAGLLATNSIRGGLNRRVLDRVTRTGGIFLAWSDEPWIVEGASVRVSIVGQDDGTEAHRSLDGEPVSVIHSDLTGGSGLAVDLTTAVRLKESTRVAFLGAMKAGPFDIPRETAMHFLLAPPNVQGLPNSDVVVPRLIGKEITRRSTGGFVIDFGTSTTESEAAEYELPFEWIKEHVLPIRMKSRRKAHRLRWWLHGDARPGLRKAIGPLMRFIMTPAVAKYRVFVWVYPPTLPDQSCVAIAREDDYAFGVLSSRPHEIWSLRTGTWLGKGNDPRYTPSSAFETYPFPWPLNTPDGGLTLEQKSHRDAIASAASALNEARERWLNPPEFVRQEPDVIPELPPRLVPVDEDAEKQLKARTLTNLYNERPTWLANAHAALDAAVFAAYGWPETPDQLTDAEILARLLKLNLERESV